MLNTVNRDACTNKRVRATVNQMMVGWLEFNVPFQQKYSYIRDEMSGVQSYPLTQ